LVRAARACYDMAIAFGTPYISGKDSFYNEFSDGSQTIAIPPTLLISAICVLKDSSKVISMDAKQAGSSVYLVGNTANELGGSQYYKALGYVGNAVPKVDAILSRQTMFAMHSAIDRGLVAACHDCSEGGLGVAAAELAFSGGFGLSLDLRAIARSENVQDSASALFSESNSRFLVEIRPGCESDFEALFKGIPYSQCGTLTSEKAFRVTGLDAAMVVETDIDTLKNTWQAPLIF
ncbi:MAG: phosphoribosylformylglycinamidine synthase, partial [Candidatus Latescibacteria bacterium]|nr:phosphoribosylformylglycinamidine synthase [Candidatus Latescibacterota bacterium]